MKEKKPKILVLLYSMYGHTLRMADAVVEGVREAGGIPILKQVAELIPEKSWSKNMKKAKIPVLPFKHFFCFDELTEFVNKLAEARTDLVSLGSLGRSRDGRDIHMLTITDPATGSAHDKPAYLIHGNIHASELSGTHAALNTARQLLVDCPRSDLLKRVAFYIVPRINPDGAEFAVTTSGQSSETWCST